jgi:SMC interacting uncharacterized protein involved in chromosome segregation
MLEAITEWFITHYPLVLVFLAGLILAGIIGWFLHSYHSRIKALEDGKQEMKEFIKTGFDNLNAKIDKQSDRFDNCLDRLEDRLDRFKESS